MVDWGERVGELSDTDVRSAACALAPGETAGDYVVTDVLAHGGGGTVYGARHRASGRLAAVKVLHQSLAVVPKMVERFRREVQALNLLRHPGIVEVWEVGALPDGRPYFVMERLQGKTLSTLLEEGGRMLPDEAIDIFEPVCLALAAAHSAGVVHRDVKATNIMILDGAPRRIKLLDFGVAKLCGPAFSSSGLTSEGQAIGTPTSMAPEQILGRAVDVRTDVYALGVLLYRMLTGRPPFMAVSPLAQMRQHLEEPAPSPSLRAPAATSLDPIVLRCMEKDADRRYPSVGELLAAIRAAVSGTPRRVETPPGAMDVAAAVYVELRIQPDTDDDDGRLSDRMGEMLDLSEEMLAEGGLFIGLTTGNEVLGVRPLPSEPAAASRELAKVASVANALRGHLDEHERQDARVHANLCVHVGEVVLRASPAVEVVGGPLFRTDLWAPHDDVAAVCATNAAMRRLHGKELPESLEFLVPLAPVDPELTVLPRR